MKREYCEYEYFVSYFYASSSSFVFAHCGYFSNTKIESMDDVAIMAKQIQHDSNISSTPAILNFVLLKEPSII